MNAAEPAGGTLAPDENEMSVAPQAGSHPLRGLLLWLLPALGALLGSAFFLLREHQIARTWGFSCDDAWIHAVIARNLAEGHGYSFNPGESVGGSSAPVYTLVLALLYRITGNMVWSAKALGILCHALASALFARAALAIDSDARGRALLAGLLFAVSPLLLWASVSGMEIPLYLLIVVAGVLFYARRRGLWSTAFWTLGVWVRPDGILLVLLGLIAPWRDMLRRAGLAAIILAAYVLFNLHVGGIAVPQSAVVKTHGTLLGFEHVWNVVREWCALWGIPYRKIDDPRLPVVLLPIMVWGAVILLRRFPAVSILPFALPLALGLITGSSAPHGRYLAAVIPLGVILAMAGAGAVLRLVPLRRTVIPPSAIGVILLLWTGASAYDMAALHGWNVQNVNAAQRWLGTVAEKLTAPGDAIATNDIGAIGYFSHRRVVDLIGLISPVRSLPENLRVYRPKLVIVYASWFWMCLREDPERHDIYFTDSDSLYRYSGLFGVQLLHNTINSRSRISVFIRRRPDEPPPRQRWVYNH